MPVSTSISLLWFKNVNPLKKEAMKGLSTWTIFPHCCIILGGTLYSNNIPLEAATEAENMRHFPPFCVFTEKM